MAGNSYKLVLDLSDGSQIEAGSFIAPQGPQGPAGANGAQGATGPAGPAGANGDPGVYVGNTEPTDDDILIWLKPDEDTGDDAVAASVSYVDSKVAGVLAANLTDMKDFIVAKGTSGVWDYLKFNNGLAMCWGMVTKTVNITTAWGSMYEAPFDSTSYPFNFKEKPMRIAVGIDISGGALVEYPGGGSGSTSNTGTVYLVKPVSHSNASATIGYFVIGKWK